MRKWRWALAALAILVLLAAGATIWLPRPRTAPAGYAFTLLRAERRPDGGWDVTVKATALGTHRYTTLWIGKVRAATPGGERTAPASLFTGILYPPARELELLFRVDPVEPDSAGLELHFVTNGSTDRLIGTGRFAGTHAVPFAARP